MVDNLIVLGIDGGNSKTDVLLVDSAGNRLGQARGSGSSAHHIGLDRTVSLLGELVAEARADAGLVDHTQLEHVAICVAGVDLPEEEKALLDAVRATGWAREATVRNDTFALLHAGSPAGWGVAMVLGAGTNCVGVDQNGRVEGFLSLGSNTGDWGGGFHLGALALHHASRAEDGRGPATTLSTMVAHHFGLATAYDVAIAVHQRTIATSRLVELTHAVFAAADAGDEVAAMLIEAQAREVVVVISTIISRLAVGAIEVPIVLGGGLLTTRHPDLMGPITEGLLDVAPRADIVVTSLAPVVGAALMALDAIGADSSAGRRLRTEAAS